MTNSWSHRMLLMGGYHAMYMKSLTWQRAKRKTYGTCGGPDSREDADACTYWYCTVHTHHVSCQYCTLKTGCHYSTRHQLYIVVSNSEGMESEEWKERLPPELRAPTFRWSLSTGTLILVGCRLMSPTSVPHTQRSAGSRAEVCAWIKMKREMNGRLAAEMASLVVQYNILQYRVQ